MIVIRPRSRLRAALEQAAIVGQQTTLRRQPPPPYVLLVTVTDDSSCAGPPVWRWRVFLDDRCVAEGERRSWQAANDRGRDEITARAARRADR